MTYYTFPLRAGTKLPAVRDWPNQAKPGTPAGHVGIFTGRFGDDEALVVIDVDCKSGKPGYDSLLELELSGLELPATATQKTPSGGIHYIYRAPHPVRSGVDVLGPGLDIRSAGGYICNYAIQGRPMPAPQWLLEKLKPAGKVDSPKQREQPAGVNAELALQRGLAILQAEPPASEGGRNNALARLVARLGDVGCTPDQIYELVTAHWQCEPPLSDEEIQTTVRSAYRSRREAPGVDAVEAQFEQAELSADQAEKASPLESVNAEGWAVIMTTDVLVRQWHDDNGEPQIEYVRPATFSRWFRNRPYGEGRAAKSLGDAWLEWKGRRQFERIVFNPNGGRPGELNTWLGWSVNPLPEHDVPPAWAVEAWERFCDHVSRNVAGEAHAHWFMCYLAHLFQRPGELPQVAIAMRGRKGTGKSIIVDCLSQLIPSRHVAVLANREQLFGKFNGRLESALLVVGEEAVWAGSHAENSALKHMITGRTREVERKGVDSYSVNNYARLFIIGNEDWIVPASDDERRYAVFNVSDERRGDRDYFAPLVRFIHSTGEEGRAARAYWLRQLMNWRLDVQPYPAPETEALIQQIAHGAPPPVQFLRHCIEDGGIPLPGGSYLDWPDSEPLDIDKRTLYAAFEKWARDRKMRPCSVEAFMRDYVLRFADGQRHTRKDGSRQRVLLLPALQHAGDRLQILLRV